MLADIKGRKFVVILALCGINIDFAWREMVCMLSHTRNASLIRLLSCRLFLGCIPNQVGMVRTDIPTHWRRVGRRRICSFHYDC